MGGSSSCLYIILDIVYLTVNSIYIYREANTMEHEQPQHQLYLYSILLGTISHAL